jgi:two-component sensor histidine kinase
VTLGGANSERVLILAPHGRDAEIASALLMEAGNRAFVCADMEQLLSELKKGAAFAVLTEEAALDSDLAELSSWVEAQPPWSDMPVVLLTARVERAAHYQDMLGNVTYLERPFHPTTLVSIARSAIRSRRRQYEARASLDQHILLARELQHRTKNLLSVVQSIASATLPGDPTRESYFKRLHALAKAQDLLMKGDGRGASFKQLVAQVLESFGQRVLADGPDLFINATTAQGFALILHELATNAAKHGSLSGQTGTISVQWSHEAGPPPALFFSWCERGGPPASPPKHKSFGTKLLEVAVASADAPPRFRYRAQGFDYELRAVLDGHESMANN